jgi:hypothetical protein
MFKQKFLIVFCGFIMIVLFTSPIEGKAENISNTDFYDSYNTLLAPYASEAIRSKL